MRFDEYFQDIFVINLAHRRDRRREMQKELARAGIRARFFNAVKVKDWTDWPSLGAKGCFLSHYAILKQARDAGLKNVLILEDDVDFVPGVQTLEAELVQQISQQPWDFMYAGHVASVPEQTGSKLRMLDWTDRLVTAHFYGVNGAVLPQLVSFLDEVQSRPSGHPMGGPQHIDGAFSMFRKQNPHLRTLIASPVLGTQRGSRSDISSSWSDTLPAIGHMIELGRKIRRKVSRRV